MSNKGRMILSVAGVILSATLLVICAILAEERIMNSATATVLVSISVVFVWMAVFYAAKVDYETGIYECRKCRHTFKPTFKAYICGAHTLKTRYLKCPECNQKSWCNRKSL